MREEQIQDLILHLIRQIAPEADMEDLQPERRFRDQFDFDSVDFLSFATALQEKLQLNIPEEDYPCLSTLQGCVSYLSSRSAGDAPICIKPDETRP